MSSAEWHVVPDDHPAVVKAMRLYDDVLNEDERRGIFQNLIRAVAAANDTGDNAPLVAFAESLKLTVRLRLIPEYQQAMRDSQNRPPARYEDCVDVTEMLAEFREAGDDL
jgi:hypothetical protein